MAKASKDSATQGGDHGPVVDRSEELDGYTVNFLTFRQDMDQTPLLKGMPDDRCQCPHWGFVTKGSLTFRFADHEEVFEAGDAFYLPPGHVGVGNGMTVVVGRVRSDPILDVKLVAMGHNIVRGAAGASVLNAELMVHCGALAGS